MNTKVIIPLVVLLFNLSVQVCSQELFGSTYASEGKHNEISSGEMPSIILNEVVVLPQISANAIIDSVMRVYKKNESRLSYRGTVTCCIDSKGYISTCPKELLQVIRTFMSLYGYRKLLDISMKTGHIEVTLAGDVNCSFGKYGFSNYQFISSNCKLLPEEQNFFMKKKWHIDSNIYHQICKIVKRVKKKSKNHEHLVTIKGVYSQSDKKIIILSSQDIELHVIEGSWQICKLLQQSDKKQYTIECEELIPDVYLPIRETTLEYYSINEKEPFWSIKESLTYKYNLAF